MDNGRLNKINVDGPFFTGQDRMISKLRKKNINAWQLDVVDDPNSVFYCLMRQKNGDIYLTFMVTVQTNN